MLRDKLGWSKIFGFWGWSLFSVGYMSTADGASWFAPAAVVRRNKDAPAISTYVKRATRGHLSFVLARPIGRRQCHRSSSIIRDSVGHCFSICTRHEKDLSSLFDVTYKRFQARRWRLAATKRSFSFCRVDYSSFFIATWEKYKIKAQSRKDVEDQWVGAHACRVSYNSLHALPFSCRR